MIGVGLIALGICALPMPAIAHHVVDTVLGFPAEFGFGLCGIAVAGGDVAGATGLDAVGHIDAIDTGEGFYHIEDRVSMPCTNIIDSDATVTTDGL